MRITGRRQKLVLVVAGAIAVALLVVVPVGYPTTYGRLTSETYAVIGTTSGTSIDGSRILLSYVVLAALAWIGVTVTADEK